MAIEALLRHLKIQKKRMDIKTKGVTLKGVHIDLYDLCNDGKNIYIQTIEGHTLDVDILYFTGIAFDVLPSSAATKAEVTNLLSELDTIKPKRFNAYILSEQNRALEFISIEDHQYKEKTEGHWGVDYYSRNTKKV